MGVILGRADVRHYARVTFGAVPPTQQMTMRTLLLTLCLSLIALPALAQDGAREYRVLATSKTSTMEKEMNAAAEAGYAFAAVMGGETAFGGNETVVVMQKDPKPSAMSYKLLAANKTGTIHKEIRVAADAGFHYAGQTVFSSAFGGAEVVVIMERDKDNPTPTEDYLVIATSKTSTLEKEMNESGAKGYQAVAMTVGTTALGGQGTRGPREARPQVAPQRIAETRTSAVLRWMDQNRVGSEGSSAMPCPSLSTGTIASSTSVAPAAGSRSTCSSGA